MIYLIIIYANITSIYLYNSNILDDFLQNVVYRYLPHPGIEPGPPGWKLGILAIRPCGMMENKIESWKFIN